MVGHLAGMAAGRRTIHTSQAPAARARVPVARGNGIEAGNSAYPVLQIDRLHRSFRVTRTGSNALWRRRVNTSEIVLG